MVENVAKQRTFREHLFLKSCEGLVWATLKSWGLMRAEDALAAPPPSSVSFLSAATITVILIRAGPQVCPCLPMSLADPDLLMRFPGLTTEWWSHGYRLAWWQWGLC